MSKFVLKTKPWEHQLKALNYLYKRDAAALYTKPGSGKTKIMIDLCVNRKFGLVLVVAPAKPCKVWKEQILLHSDVPEENITELFKMSTKEKAEFLKTHRFKSNGFPEFLVCNYESIWREPLDRIWMYKRVPLDCIICDESHRIKSPSSKCSRFLTKLGKRVNHRYLVTGTPLAENPMDVYAQYRFLDPSIFGTNYFDFCSEYQNIDPVRTAKVGYTILDRHQPYKNLDTLQEKMFSCAFYMDSVVELPQTHTEMVKVSVPEEVETLYKEVEKEGATEYGDGFMTVDNILSMSIRKQQILSGYLPLEYDDGTKELKRISRYRAKALYKLIKRLPKSDQIVVFARFRKDLDNIRLVASKLSEGYSEVSGSEDTLEEWKENKTRILGVQYKSGSEGISLVNSCRCIFYTLNHSLALFEQAKERTHRPGQTREVTYYIMQATLSRGKSIDQDIYSCLEHKKDYVQAVMNGDIE